MAFAFSSSAQDFIVGRSAYNVLPSLYPALVMWHSSQLTYFPHQQAFWLWLLTIPSKSPWVICVYGHHFYKARLPFQQIEDFLLFMKYKSIWLFVDLFLCCHDFHLFCQLLPSFSSPKMMGMNYADEFVSNHIGPLIEGIYITTLHQNEIAKKREKKEVGLSLTLLFSFILSHSCLC